MRNRYLAQSLFAVLALALTGATAAAATVTWGMRTNDGCGATGEPACPVGNQWGNQRRYMSDGTILTATAYADTGGLTNGANSRSIETALLTWYSGNGLGVKNQDSAGGDPGEGSSPEHAIDNNDRVDGVLLAFSALTRLTHVDFGYTSGDADFSVLFYTGAGTPTLDGSTYGGLLGAGGWSILGNYADPGTGWEGLFNATQFSRFWLITAYNDVFGVGNWYSGTYYQGGKKLGEGNDHFKLGGAKGETRDVPEPGSLALLGLGLLGLGAARRRR